MNKQANKNSLLNTVLDSTLLGAGGYGIYRALERLLQEKKKKEEKPRKNRLELPVPKNMIGEKKAGDESIISWGPRALTGIHPAALLTIPAAAMGVDEIYKRYMQKKLQEQQEEEKRKRLQLMQKLSNEQTPHVDAFCEKVAEELNKLAKDENFLRRAGGWLNDKSSNFFSVNPVAKDSANASVAGMWPAKPFRDTMLTILLMSAALTGGAMISARKKRDKAEARTQYPTRLSIDPAAIKAVPVASNEPESQPATPYAPRSVSSWL